MFHGLSEDETRQLIYVEPNIEARSRNQFCNGKAKRITYSASVFEAIVIQRAFCMCSIIFSSVSCLSVKYFSTLSHKRHDFRKKKLPDVRYVFRFSLQLLCEIFLIKRGNERVVIKNVYRSSKRYPFFLCFNEA